MKWVDLIMLCVSIVRYFIMHNGHKLGPIVPRRGLRQGDPLSPYLFILCAEGLSALISHHERMGLWQGCKISRLAPVTSHLCFADDCLLFFKANVFNADII